MTRRPRTPTNPARKWTLAPSQDCSKWTEISSPADAVAGRRMPARLLIATVL